MPYNVPSDSNPPSDTSSTPEQREIARTILQTILEMGEPSMIGPKPFGGRTSSWLVGEGSLCESSVAQADWEPEAVFRYDATCVWRRSMAFELLKRMDDLDRDTKNAVIKLVWAALPNPSVISVLMSYAPGERPVSIPDTTPAPKVLSDAALRSRAMIAHQFGGFSWARKEEKVEPQVR
jgi:hypothetical protein